MPKTVTLSDEQLALLPGVVQAVAYSPTYPGRVAAIAVINHIRDAPDLIIGENDIESTYWSRDDPMKVIAVPINSYLYFQVVRPGSTIPILAMPIARQADGRNVHPSPSHTPSLGYAGLRVGCRVAPRQAAQAPAGRRHHAGSGKRTARAGVRQQAVPLKEHLLMVETCQRCKSQRLADVCAKCSDMCSVAIGSGGRDGYVPSNLGIGGGDYIEFSWCLDCGNIAGEWPVPPHELEKP